MASKKYNSGGGKFKGRLDGEKRPRAVKKDESGNSRGPRGGYDQPRTNAYNEKRGDAPRGRKPFGSDNSRDGGDRKPYGRKPSGDSGYSRDGGDRKPYARKPSGDSGYSRDGGDRKPYGRKPSGDSGYSRDGGDRKPYGRKPSGDSGYSRDGSDRKPYGRKPSGDSGYSRDGGDRKPYGRKPSGDSGYSRDGGDRKPYGRKPSGDSGYSRPPATRKPYARKSDSFEEGPKVRKSQDGTRILKPRRKDRAQPPSNFKGRGRGYNETTDNLLNAEMLSDTEVRLNRYIANSGICSRREADVLIEQGLVTLNGEVVKELGEKVKPGDEVKLDGRRITPEKPVYILLNKPKGYITSTADPDGRATVMDLIDMPGKERVYPVGRLDRNTTGVLLLTNDGELSQKLMHPSFEIKKIYRARLDKKPAKEHMLAWVNGVELEDGWMSFEQIGFVDEEDNNTVGLEVHSGRNRIVRRMFEHFGYEVETLDRVMLGEFDHLKLGRGKWRLLTPKEILYVERLKRMKPKKR